MAPRESSARQLIRLKARAFSPKPGIGKGVAEHLKSLAGRKERPHLLVQFHEVPDLGARRRLARQFGLRLLDPLPERAFFASIDPELGSARRLVGAGGPVRWVGVIEPGDKVAPSLRRGSVPQHARRKDGVELIVQFFGDVPVRRQRQVLTAHAATVLVRIGEINGWRLILTRKTISGLARQDPVKWIVEIPLPPQDDNDGVRSLTGLDADAVLAPSIYGLTGAGVVVGQWETTHASLTHADFAGRIVVADPPLALSERTHAHDEAVAANGSYDAGEAIYVDVDDDLTVSAGDIRSTAVAGFAAGTVVAAGDADVGTALVMFGLSERFTDTVTPDFAYTAGEAIYLDADNNFLASVGDTRRTAVGAFAAGSAVAAGDADVGQPLRSFPTNPHYHATHVAGTVMGSGAQSATEGGAPSQWKGVAPGATLRSYRIPVLSAEYADAVANGVRISTNSWGSSHIHQVVPPNTGYDINSAYYDAVISGRQSDGTPSGLAQRVLICGSAGNQGRPERHAENVAANGAFDIGEAIYIDNDDSGTVTAGDTLVSGPAQPIGTPLVNFNPNEMHDETASTSGTYQAAEGIYLDADGSRTVSAGDTRITAAAGFPVGSVVAAGDLDAGRLLRPFRLWGNVRIPNSAKDTVEVANISSDAAVPAASSSRGPTDDGRTKPDVAGPGTQNSGDLGVTSTFPGNAYFVDSGTSMATPAVAGVAALLTEWYQTACAAGGSTPDLLRAILAHASEELASIPNVGTGFEGPDYAHGYGRVRAKESVDVLPHHVAGTATAVGDTDYTVTIGAIRQLKVTLAWDDPAWTANAAPSAVTGILQNDLDLVLIGPDGTQHTPWVLNPANPFTPASRSSFPIGTPIPEAARDRRNTQEQVVVDDAMAGTWTIRVSASTLNLPPQSYVVVSEVFAPQAGPCASTPAADVWMQDNAADTGAVPSTGTMWLSPDVWNRLMPDGMAAHQNPEYGQVNHLYATIRNATAVTVFSTSIDIWLAPASAGLAWPDDFTLVGRIPVANLGPLEVRQVGPLGWDPPPPSPSDHFCLYVRVQSPQDPITFAETTSVGTNAANSNNIVWRNLNVVDLLSSAAVTFLLRNTSKKRANVELEIVAPDELLADANVDLRLSIRLEQAWPHRYRKLKGILPLEPRYRIVRAGEPPFEDHADDRPPANSDEVLPAAYRIVEPTIAVLGLRMEAKEAESVTLTFSSRRRLRKAYEVDVVERIGNQTIGGIRYIVRSGKGPSGP